MPQRRPQQRQNNADLVPFLLQDEFKGQIGKNLTRLRRVQWQRPGC
jgi:hypothetical protein